MSYEHNTPLMTTKLVCKVLSGFVRLFTIRPVCGWCSKLTDDKYLLQGTGGESKNLVFLKRELITFVFVNLVCEYKSVFNCFCLFYP